MNGSTSESLDIDFIFKKLIPVTPFGIYEKNTVRPYKIGEESLLEREYDKIESIIEEMELYEEEFREMEEIFKGVKEIRNSLKSCYEGRVIDEVELFEIKNFVFSLADISSIQMDMRNFPEELKLKRLEDIEKLLDPEGYGNRTFYIYDSYSEELKKIREQKKRLQVNLEAERRKIFREVESLLGLKIKLNGEVTIQKRDDEAFQKANGCPYLLQGPSTILGATFRIKNTSELDALEEELENLKFLEGREEYVIRKRLSNFIGGSEEEFLDAIKKLGELDYIMAKAKMAVSIGGTRPLIQDEVAFSIRGGRHIKLEEILKRKGKRLSPISLNSEKGVTIITGANMGGKTASLKLVGMLTAMSHFGLFVPAEGFKTCLFDYIYFSIGDRQSLDTGLSTFGSEIDGIIEILEHSDRRGLILIDELARGTNPREGYAISRAIVRYLKDKEAITIFATHFEGIIREDGIIHLQVRGLKGINIDLIVNKKGGVSSILDYMDYTLERVEENYKLSEDAINIAKLMGLDSRIITWAEDILMEEDNIGKAST